MKKYTTILITLALLFISVYSCKKETKQTPPTNLVVNAVVNPDSSGNVDFTVSADNAVSFEYNFGDGRTGTISSGTVTHKYYSTKTYTVTVTATSSSGLTIQKSIQVNVGKAYLLIWSDEFNTDGAPDPAKWGYDLGGGGWGNNELENYTNRPVNASVKDGLLKINLIRENYQGNTFTSARLLTKDKFAFTYGKVEAKAKLPAGGGTWPAIWMLGSNISTVPWPACGEIDIMEHVGNDLNRVYGTLHYPGHSGGNADGKSVVIQNAATAFHIYSLEWDPSFIRIFVDGQLIHNVGNTLSIPFNHDFFLIMNVAMGGYFGGAADPAFTSASMEVDYIRVYQ